MAVLSSQQRRRLEATVKKARRVSEEAAMKALQSLGVDHHEPFPHLTAEQRSLRNILRSKARLLGDELLPDGRQQIRHLAYELAYESWHKMLFASFLEANELLMHPEGVAVTLEECEELAKEEGFADKWETAAAYASAMLPAIFRPDDPLMQVQFATEDRLELEKIIDNLDDHVFVADDALGWVYQYWQSEAKEIVNKEVKQGILVDGERLPAVTQLFTEPYMVHFLIDNTIGAWWVNRNPGVKPPVAFKYLRLLDDGTPAAGKFEGWPEKAAEITIMDPSMGSGHFLVDLFMVLAPLRMYEEGLTKEEAADKVIAENLHGLEIDPRCTQLAAFNLAFTAWKFVGHYMELPEMNLACSGIAPKGKVEDWVKLVGKVADPVDKERMENGMRALYEHFQLAPELGSLLDPATLRADAFTASFEQLRPVLKKALEKEAGREQRERGVMAAGIAKAGQLLSERYTLQITNVPYLSRGKQDEIMANYCKNHFPVAKGDLATVFLERMLKSNLPGGVSSCVIPQNWLFLTSYKKLREKLLKNESWYFVARLGAKGFQTPMWDFNVMLLAIQHIKPEKNHTFSGLDVSEAPDAAAKAEAIKTAGLKMVNQKEQLRNPDARIILTNVSSNKILNDVALSLQGIKSGDDARYRLSFLEVNDFTLWKPIQGTVKKTKYFGGLSDIIYWIDNGQYLSRRQGVAGWGKKGVSVSQIGKLPCSIHIGFVFDSNVSAIIPHDNKLLNAIWCYCSSSEYDKNVRELDQALAASNAAMAQVSFDIEYWQKVAEEKYPDGLPKPYSDDPTQWLFHGHPVKAEHPLQVAVARMLGYRWPAEYDQEMELSDEARALIEDVKRYDHHTDDDGIVCLPRVHDEIPAAGRLHDYLQEVFADEWDDHAILRLLEKEGATSNALEKWLQDEFFAQHLKVFKNRPFIWHIWDGRKDGFSALVNYHKLDRDNLSKLIYTYLGDWIRTCEIKKKEGESGAEGLLNASLQLKKQLEAILEGEAPYDIFVRWKPLEEQPIGWDPDLNDGVRLNIRPFVETKVLRKKPNIKWGIDRGKNPPGSPWGEVRDNSRHLTLAEKKAARKRRNLNNK